MRVFLLLVIALMTLTFVSFSFGFQSRNKREIVSDRLIKKISEKLRRKYNMFLVGVGGSTKEGKYRQISNSYERYGEPLNLEQSRKMMLDCIQVYLDEINSNKEIQPYLTEHPYKAENLDISIINFYPHGSITLNPHISDITEIKGFLYYRTQSSLKEPYTSEFKETYQEALAKVKQRITIKQDSNKNVDSKDESGVAKRLEYETPVSFSDRTSTTSP